MAREVAPTATEQFAATETAYFARVIMPVLPALRRCCSSTGAPAAPRSINVIGTRRWLAEPVLADADTARRAVRSGQQTEAAMGVRPRAHARAQPTAASTHLPQRHVTCIREYHS